MLLGGGNRIFADHVGASLRRSLPAYDIVTDIDAIPEQLRGLHDRNPVNLSRDGGVQIELPPRVRGSSPLWWDWEGPGLTPHTESLIDGLVEAATTWPGHPAQPRIRSPVALSANTPNFGLSGQTGRSTSTTPPGPSPTAIEPPWAVTMPRAIDNPSPAVPVRMSRAGSARVNGSKAWSLKSVGKPGP